MLKPITLVYTIFNRKGTPLRLSSVRVEQLCFFHIPTQEHCVPFLNPWNKVMNDVTGENQALLEEMLTEKNKLPNARFP